MRNLWVVLGLLAFAGLIAVSNWQDNNLRRSRVGTNEYAIHALPGLPAGRGLPNREQ